MPDIGLTEDQKKEIAGIRKAGMAKVKDAKPEERREIMAQIRKDIHAVFTKEQLEKLQKARGEGGQGRGGRPDLGLTDEQKEKMAAIRKETATKMKDAKPGDRKAIMEESRKKFEALLTPEQLEKLKKARQGGPQRGRGGRPELGLTDEQKEKAAAIRKETAAKMKDAKPEERKAIMEASRKQFEALLTPEQLEKLKKARQGGRPGGDKRGEGRRRGGKGPKGGEKKGGRKRPAAE